MLCCPTVRYACRSAGVHTDDARRRPQGHVSPELIIPTPEMTSQHATLFAQRNAPGVSAWLRNQCIINTYHTHNSDQVSQHTSTHTLLDGTRYSTGHAAMPHTFHTQHTDDHSFHRSASEQINS
jgi:hypothetical protein